MNALQTHDRLEKLDGEINQLRIDLIECERDAADNGDDDAQGRVASVRTGLHLALNEHFELSRRVLATSCPTHGPHVIIMACRGCIAADEARDRAHRVSRAA